MRRREAIFRERMYPNDTITFEHFKISVREYPKFYKVIDVQVEISYDMED